jgi:hypothetical protein
MTVRARRSIVLSLGVALAGMSVAHADLPVGWYMAGSAPKDYEASIDKTTAATGKSSALIVAKPSASGFGTLMQNLAADAFRGHRWRLTGYMRTEDALRAQMWMRVDGADPQKTLAFDNMDWRPVQGTTPWRRYEIVLDVPKESIGIAYGFFLMQKGKVWGDGFKFERVDTSVPTTAAPAVMPRAPVNSDFEQ